MLRKQVGEKFDLERKLKESERAAEDLVAKVNEADARAETATKESDKTRKALELAMGDIIRLNKEVEEGRRSKESEAQLEKLRSALAALEDEGKSKGRRIGELTVELEDMKTKYVNIKTEFEDLQASQELVQKKNTNDLKELRRQYNKEKELGESLAQTKTKLEAECKELKEKLEIAQRSAVPSRSVTTKEKAIVEALSMRAEMLADENEKLQKTIADLKKRIDSFETESKVRLQLLVNYAAKYAQDHLEEYKEM